VHVGVLVEARKGGGSDGEGQVLLLPAALVRVGGIRRGCLRLVHVGQVHVTVVVLAHVGILRVTMGVGTDPAGVETAEKAQEAATGAAAPAE